MLRVADLFVANLPSEGHRAKRDDKEEIGNVGLDALPVQDLTFTRAEGEKMYIGAHQLQKGHSLAGLVDDLLEQVGELLDDGHGLS